MPEVRPAYPEDAEAILPVLAEFNDPFIGRDDWLRFLSYPWRADQPCGFVLADKGRMVGFLGALFCKRWIKDRSVTFVNLHSWIVLPSYRANSLAMMAPILRLRDHLITDFTPSPVVYAVSRKLGFRDLDSHAYFFPALRKPSRRAATSMDLAEISTQLPPDVGQLVRDHRSGVEHLLVTDERHQCYVAYGVIRRTFPHHCHLLHSSDPEALRHHVGTIARHVARRHGCRGLLVDGRFMSRRPAQPWVARVPMRKLCRGPEIDPTFVDNLYSELVFGKVSTLPRLSSLLSYAREGLPGSRRN